MNGGGDGITGSSTALVGRLPLSARVMAAVMRSHAVAASPSYMNWAGQVLPLSTRPVSSHRLVMRLSWPKSWSLGSWPRRGNRAHGARYVGAKGTGADSIPLPGLPKAKVID